MDAVSRELVNQCFTHSTRQFNCDGELVATQLDQQRSYNSSYAVVSVQASSGEARSALTACLCGVDLHAISPTGISRRLAVEPTVPTVIRHAWRRTAARQRAAGIEGGPSVAFPRRSALSMTRRRHWWKDATRHRHSVLMNRLIHRV